ncbi:Protein BOLA2 [Zea mays]|uniref:Protein BOLA2 n=1 Tax=Zea mays TaxID=4577 RepID=A0A3L6FM54_MAIZE|nr:Protein BOLA2 [Zea mays]
MGVTKEDVEAAITSALSPSNLVVTDTSGGCGASYEIEVVSEKFEGKRLLERHRMVSVHVCMDPREQQHTSVVGTIADFYLHMLLAHHNFEDKGDLLGDYFRPWSQIADSGFPADDLEEDTTVWTLEPSVSTVWQPTWIRFSGYDLETVSLYPPQAPLVATAEESLDSGLFADHRVEWVNCPLCGRNSRNGRPSYLVMPSSPDVFGTAH